MTAGKFRKLPIEIEAMHHDGTSKSADAIREWTDNDLMDHWVGGKGNRGMTEFIIQTLEGAMTAGPGDWIVRGVKGEYYPVKPDIFERTYEAVEVEPEPEPRKCARCGQRTGDVTGGSMGVCGSCGDELRMEFAAEDAARDAERSS